MMRQVVLWFGIGLIVLSSGYTNAQDEALPELALNKVVTGSITTQDDLLTWQFFALQNEMLTLSVVGEGDFDPILRLLDDQDNIIASNDDYLYPNTSDAMLEGLTIPWTGFFHVTVTGYMGSLGNFALVRLVGYGDLVAGPDLSDFDWQASERVSYFAGSEGVSVEVGGNRERGYLVDTASQTYDDAYVEIHVPRIEGVGGWVVGIILRWTSESNYYSAEISSQGLWRLVEVDGEGLRVVRDWTAHPGLQGDKSSFRFGVLMRGTGFELFFDGQIIGQAQDDAISEGHVGIIVVGSDTVGSRTTAFVDQLIVTIPVKVDNQYVFPQQLIMGNSSQIIHELERRGVIPYGGNMSLTVAESFIERRADGVDTLSLGRGARYQHFALGTTVSLEEADAVLSGCGLMLRGRDVSNYMIAYKDVQGGYGLSERRGNVFSEGIFGENADWAGLAGDHLLVVAVENKVHYFVNGFYVGSATVTPIESIVGNAILNYRPVNAVCRFTDTWLWQFD